MYFIILQIEKSYRIHLDSGLGESGSDNVSMRMLLTKVVFVLTEEGTHTLYSRRTAIVMVKVGTQEEY